jgi:FOG: WD40 repeat
VPPLEISPNGNFIAVSTSNGDVKIYDHSSGKVSTLPKNQLPIRAISFHPSSRILIAASKDGFIKIWDILTAREIKLIDVKIPIQTVSVSPNGKWFAAGVPSSNS